MNIILNFYCLFEDIFKWNVLFNCESMEVKNTIDY